MPQYREIGARSLEQFPVSVVALVILHPRQHVIDFVPRWHCVHVPAPFTALVIVLLSALVTPL